MRFDTGNYIRSSEEMLQAAIKCGSEESFYNTKKVVDLCEDFNPGLSAPRMPMFDIAGESDYKDYLDWRSKKKS